MKNESRVFLMAKVLDEKGIGVVELADLPSACWAAAQTVFAFEFRRGRKATNRAACSAM
jgi:hypothetical protein